MTGQTVYVVLVRDEFDTEADVSVDSVWADEEAANRHADAVRGWIEKHELR